DVGYCARPGAVDVRLAAGGAAAEKIVREGEAVVEKILGANLFGFDDEEIEQVIVKLLRQQNKTLALAESCTGGAIAQRITDVPGASDIFPGGVVSYSNEAKQKFLGVRPESLAAHGAVSEVVAREMAQGARERFGADFALAVTGIAGPGGGSAEKPVGTVFIALATAQGAGAKQFLNKWERATFKQVTAMQALEWLRHVISA
ncbi:MAG TPA: nicotinamide-nucleotide amidohydrolase family protein, partial [Candidatus Binatia bacterium]|nr:nicotinamide-nucleotide amidohydrolase family protein [Candidatus Binatia bacterium]